MELNDVAGPDDAIAQLGWEITMGAHTVTRAFSKVKVQVYTEDQLIFVWISLRLYAKLLPAKVHRIWLEKALERLKMVTPQGYKISVAYNNLKMKE